MTVIASYTVACSRDELKAVRDRLGDQLEIHGVRGLLRDQIVLAVDEACANAIIHGHDCDSTRRIRLEADLESGWLTVRIRDVGEFEMDPDLLHRDIGYYLRNRLQGGLGLRLIHAIMDEVRFEQEDGAMVCILRKEVEG